MDYRLVSGRGHLLQTFRRPSCDLHHGLACMQVANGHVTPGYSHSQPGSKRLGTGFLGGPTFGIGASYIATTFCFLLLHLREYPVPKPVPKAVKRSLDTLNIGQISSDT
jgi:hypothetical protein